MDWPPKLTIRDEKQRAAHGLTIKRDGYYKSVDGKTRYICKPMPIADAVALLPGRILAIRGLTSRPAPIAPGSMTLEGLSAAYVAWLWQRLTTGAPKKLARRTYDNYVSNIFQFVELCGGQRLADTIGEEDFTLYATTYLTGVSPNTIQREVTAIEAFANWAAPSARSKGHLLKPWFFGPNFKKPSRSEMDQQASMKDKAYSLVEISKAFRAVRNSPVMNAAAHLGLNCAFEPSAIAHLREDQIDWKASLIRFPLGRGKTGVARLCPMLPDTVAALQSYMAVRPKMIDATADGLVFRTSNGLPYARTLWKEGLTEQDSGKAYDSLANRWHKITGLPLSGLRSTFATIADDYSDQRAVDVVMGHRGHIAGSVRSRFYAKRVDPDRLWPLAKLVWDRAFQSP